MAERAGLPPAVGFVGLGRMGTPMVRRSSANESRLGEKPGLASSGATSTC
jgi:hypothetical protein